jgi:hypothetical protein
MPLRCVCGILIVTVIEVSVTTTRSDSHRGSPGSIQRHAMRDLWLSKRYWKGFFFPNISVSFPVQKSNNTAVGIRHADRYPQKLVLTSPTCGGRSVGIVHSRTQATEFVFISVPLTVLISPAAPYSWVAPTEGIVK